MGSAPATSTGSHTQVLSETPGETVKAKPRVNATDSIDVVEVSNIALAIKNGDQHVINVELTVGCRNLPAPKAFETVQTMIVLFKSVPELMQIGRTQIIKHDLNPKFLTSFLLPSVSGNQQKIELHIYNMTRPEQQDLKYQKLIGTSQLNLQNLIDNDSNELEVSLVNSSIKERTFIHISCCQYDGAGNQYEVIIQASGFAGKYSFYYVIEVQKDNDWIPVAKSNTIQIKKAQHFDLLKVSSHKFPGSDTSRIRLRCYEAKTGEQLGFTDDIILAALKNDEQKGNSKRIQKNGFVVGSLIIHQWKSNPRDSFLTYIINGARLHLILGIDYTNSTFKGPQPLHHPDDNKNLYVLAIKQIVGILQYFDYYNQIALYGFGAKLPPYYRSVGQCFALNGNYFQPLIVGGVDKIVKKYRQNLQKIQPHGPSKLSEIVDMAVQFAKSSEGQSTNYYVLIVLTDGGINDFNNTRDKIIQASNFPLSIVFVCLGDGDFTEIKKLDQDQQPLKTEKNGVVTICKRDMVDVIDFKDYLCPQRNPLTQIKLARQTFAQIPAQFVGYMKGKGINPNKEKKGTKSAKNEFIAQKINSGKKKDNQPIIPEVEFLREQRKKLSRDLEGLGIEKNKAFEQTLQISMNDLSYFLEIYSTRLPPPVKEYKPFQETISSKQQRKFEERLQKNQKFINHRIQNQILKRQANQTGKRQRVMERIAEVPQKKQLDLKHPCLKCREREICIVYGDCGHLAVCEQCQQNICIVCKEFNETFYQVTE